MTRMQIPPFPLHLKGPPSKHDALARLSLHADMSSLNPKGFRTASGRKDRKRVKTRVEKLAELLHD